jgi:hypothetical protein
MWWGDQADGDIASAEMSADEFFSCLSKKVDEEGEAIFLILSRLGSALSTIYNSSSPAERDFSLVNLNVGDPSQSWTSQLVLLSKMFITAELKSLKGSRRGGSSHHIATEALDSSRRPSCDYERWKTMAEVHKDIEEKRIEEESLKMSEGVGGCRWPSRKRGWYARGSWEVLEKYGGERSWEEKERKRGDGCCDLCYTLLCIFKWKINDKTAHSHLFNQFG